MSLTITRHMLNIQTILAEPRIRKDTMRKPTPSVRRTLHGAIMWSITYVIRSLVMYHIRYEI